MRQFLPVLSFSFLSLRLRLKDHTPSCPCIFRSFHRHDDAHAACCTHCNATDAALWGHGGFFCYPYANGLISFVLPWFIHYSWKMKKVQNKTTLLILRYKTSEIRRQRHHVGANSPTAKPCDSPTRPNECYHLCPRCEVGGHRHWLASYLQNKNKTFF